MKCSLPLLLNGVVAVLSSCDVDAVGSLVDSPFVAMRVVVGLFGSVVKGCVGGGGGLEQDEGGVVSGVGDEQVRLMTGAQLHAGAGGHDWEATKVEDSNTIKKTRIQRKALFRLPIKWQSSVIFDRKNGIFQPKIVLQTSNALPRQYLLANLNVNL